MTKKYDKKEFSNDELLRYSRHILLPQIDIAGQLNIANSHVLIVGLGGLGSPVAQYLAASGVGTLSLADFDQVDASNLQRQVVHNRHSLGQNKAQSAARTLAALNEFVQIEVLPHALADELLLEAVAKADVVVDCTDNFTTRRAINRACVTLRKPLVSGAAIRFEGQLCVFDPNQPASPCYECLFPELPEENLSCSQSGVLSPLVGVIGSMQAVETLKILSGCGPTSIGQLHLYDARHSTWRLFRFDRSVDCPCCAGLI